MLPPREMLAIISEGKKWAAEERQSLKLEGKSGSNQRLKRKPEWNCWSTIHDVLTWQEKLTWIKGEEEEAELFVRRAGAPSPLTCIWWQVEDEDGQESNEDTWSNDIDQVEERFPANDEVEGDFFTLSFSPAPWVHGRLD